MLSDIEALRQIELSGELDMLCKVDSMKVIGVDQQVTPVDIRSVHAGYRYTHRGPDAEPRTVPASEIDDAADRGGSSNLWYDPLGRLNGKGCEKAIEVCPIFVQGV